MSLKCWSDSWISFRDLKRTRRILNTFKLSQMINHFGCANFFTYLYVMNFVSFKSVLKSALAVMYLSFI